MEGLSVVLAETEDGARAFCRPGSRHLGRAVCHDQVTKSGAETTYADEGAARVLIVVHRVEKTTVKALITNQLCRNFKIVLPPGIRLRRPRS